MGANTRFKASMFASLFGDPESLRALYSALIGFALSPDVPIEINTLDGILYMGQLNDISFTVGGRLVIVIEHQCLQRRCRFTGTNARLAGA